MSFYLVILQLTETHISQMTSKYFRSQIEAADYGE